MEEGDIDIIIDKLYISKCIKIPMLMLSRHREFTVPIRYNFIFTKKGKRKGKMNLTNETIGFGFTNIC